MRVGGKLRAMVPAFEAVLVADHVQFPHALTRAGLWQLTILRHSRPTVRQIHLKSQKSEFVLIHYRAIKT